MFFSEKIMFYGHGSLCLIITSLMVVESFLIPFTDPSSCEDDHYFQFSTLRCIKCQSNQKKSPDGLSCICVNGFHFVKNNGGLDVQCAQCNDGQVASFDGWSCISCPTDTDFDPVTKICKPCPDQSVVIERQLNGEFSSRKQCLSCQNDTQIVNSQGSICNRCDQSVLDITGGSCQCPVGVTFQGRVIEEGGKCLSSQSTPFINSIPSVPPQNYVFLQRNVRVAQALCNNYQNFTACQLLGNLCVLHMYNTDNFDNLLTIATDPCKEFLKLQREYKGEFNGHLDWPVSMPWLYYTSVTSTEVIYKTDLTTIFLRGQSLKFVAVKISASGRFLGITKNVDFLKLCDKSTSLNTYPFVFPTIYKSQCSLSLTPKWKTEEMTFYDLYMLIDNLFLYPVPVLLDNMHTGNQFINQDSSSKWRLTRRFFLLDNLSGLTNPDKDPEYLRYASLLELKFRLREDGLIYPPVLRVKYSDIQFTGSNLELNQEFNVLYEMDADKIIENIKIAVGTLSIICIFYAVVRIVSWRRRMGTQMLDCSTFIVFFVFLCSGLSLVFWIVSFFACFLWLLFFKHQTTVILFLPTADQEILIKSLLVVALFMKFIDILYIIYNQINLDLFFIDWERPRGAVATTIENGVQGNVLTPVSIMRTLFVANEWQEVQSCRRIKPTILLVFVLLFLKVFGFEYLCTTDPVSRYSITTSDYIGEYNFTLRFAVISFLFFSIAIIQWIVFGIFYERFISDSIRDFIDFCSMSNISLFVMSRFQYGFYIHGRSIHGRSDTSLHELYKQFQREEENLCTKRGLEPNSDQQVFEFALTANFRKIYEKILQPLMTRDVNNARRTPHSITKQNSGYPGNALPPVLELSVHAYESMNKYLTAFIEHALRDNDYIVKEKLLMEKLLNIELQPPLDKSIFYNDDRRVFTEVLLYGQEWNLFLFILLFYLVIDWISGWNTILAVVLSYFIDMALVNVRDSFGKRNLARKTMVDQRFLI